MRRAFRVAASILVLGLAGCAVDPPMQHFENSLKPGATQADLNRDHYECYRDAMNLPVQRVTVAGMTMDTAPRNQTYEMCLSAHGWRRVNK